MSVLQRVFLHTPARSPAVVEEYERQHREEGEQLDFKAIVWEKGETLKTPSLEAAKDVAAFANHLGGDIIIGINDKGDRADGWNPIPNANIPAAIGKIRDWLIKHLRPQEVAEIVDIEQVAAPQPGSSVLVVSIPPFPQLVSIEDRETDKLTFQFPIRTGRRIRWLTFEEIMSRASTSARGMYIKLKMFEANPDKTFPIRFSSPVLSSSIGSAGTVITKPAPGEDGIHCRFDSLSEETITVTMRALPSVTISLDYKLAIPLEFIRAVWEEPKRPSGTPRLFIALDAEIVWNGVNAWHLITNTAR